MKQCSSLKSCGKSPFNGCIFFNFVVVIVKDRETGESRGYGFVTFQTAEAAKAAKEKLNNSVSMSGSCCCPGMQDTFFVLCSNKFFFF